MFFRILLMLLFISSSANAATYSYYFASSGTDTPVTGGCDDSGDPCSTLAHLNTLIDALSVNDEVYAYFNRGDTWLYDTDAVGATAVLGITVTSSNPIVHFGAYGTGNRPIFDGGVTDFSSVPVHSASPGPAAYNRIFHIERDNCTFFNLEIQNFYGNGIFLKDTDGVDVTFCDIHGIGNSAIAGNASSTRTNSEIAYNTIHTGGQLELYAKSGTLEWTGSIVNRTSSGSGHSSGHHIHHNLIYNIQGEGIITQSEDGYNPTIVEFNVIGDTCSTAIVNEPTNVDFGTSIVRYNIVTHSDYATSDYSLCDCATCGDGRPVGTRWYDDTVGGDNSSGVMEIYGNVFINLWYGIRFFNPEDTGNTMSSVKIYNNTVIDSHVANYTFNHPDDAGTGYFYNNASVLYDQAGSTHISDSGVFPNAHWNIGHNAFWTTGGSPSVDVNWQTNYVTGDPLLDGEEVSDIDWDGLTGSYYTAVNASDVYSSDPASSLDGTGFNHGFDDTQLTADHDFASGENSLGENTAPKWIGAIITASSGSEPAGGPTVNTNFGLPGITLFGSSGSTGF